MSFCFQYNVPSVYWNSEHWIDSDTLLDLLFGCLYIFLFQSLFIEHVSWFGAGLITLCHSRKGYASSQSQLARSMLPLHVLRYFISVIVTQMYVNAECRERGIAEHAYTSTCNLPPASFLLVFVFSVVLLPCAKKAQWRESFEPCCWFWFYSFFSFFCSVALGSCNAHQCCTIHITFRLVLVKGILEAASHVKCAQNG